MKNKHIMLVAASMLVCGTAQAADKMVKITEDTIRCKVEAAAIALTRADVRDAYTSEQIDQIAKVGRCYLARTGDMFTVSEFEKAEDSRLVVVTASDRFSTYFVLARVLEEFTGK
jgi:hypothetical protein